MTSASVGLVLVGAGSSRRMGGVDKIWAPLAGRPVAWYSLHTLYPLVQACVLVVRPDCLTRAGMLQSDHPGLRVAPGGSQRQESVSRGLSALPAVELVAVHDVARPLVPASLLIAGVELASIHGAAIPAVPLTDTVKCFDSDGAIVSTIDRRFHRGVQTPQVFRTGELLAAHQDAAERGDAVTDDASLLERAGWTRAHVFDGSPANFKITTEFDLLLARLLVEGEWWSR